MKRAAILLGTSSVVVFAAVGTACSDDSMATAGNAGTAGSGNTGGGGTGGGIPPNCGDKIVDADEECDEGTETAACNADCTLSRCGDGYVNISAGERCEQGSCCKACDFPASPPVTARLVAGGDVALAGAVTEISNGKVSGWALDLQDPTRLVTVQLLVDDKVEDTLVASAVTTDLAGICDGCENGFTWTLPAGYLDGAGHTLKLRGTNAKVSTPSTLDQRVFGDAVQDCDIDGGLGLQLAPVQKLTRSKCQSLCNSHTQAGRQCRWGDEWLHNAPEIAHCMIKGGDGAILWSVAPMAAPWQKTILAGWALRPSCQKLCDSFNHAVNRSCRWRDEWLIPAPVAACTIKNGNVDLAAPFVGERVYCIQTCDAFPTIKNRICKWGADTLNNN